MAERPQRARTRASGGGGLQARRVRPRDPARRRSRKMGRRHHRRRCREPVGLVPREAGADFARGPLPARRPAAGQGAVRLDERAVSFRRL